MGKGIDYTPKVQGYAVNLWGVVQTVLKLVEDVKPIPKNKNIWFDCQNEHSIYIYDKLTKEDLICFSNGNMVTLVTKKVDQRLITVGTGGFKEYGMQFFHVTLPLLIFFGFVCF